MKVKVSINKILLHLNIELNSMVFSELKELYSHFIIQTPNRAIKGCCEWGFEFSTYFFSYLLSIKWGSLIAIFILSISGRSQTISNRRRLIYTRRTSPSSSPCRTSSKNYILGTSINTKNCKNKPTGSITSSKCLTLQLAPSQITSTNAQSTTGKTTWEQLSSLLPKPIKSQREIMQDLWTIWAIHCSYLLNLPIWVKNSSMPLEITRSALETWLLSFNP